MSHDCYENSFGLLDPLSPRKSLGAFQRSRDHTLRIAVLMHLIFPNIPTRQFSYYPDFTDQETEAQRSDVTYQRALSEKVAKSGSKQSQFLEMGLSWWLSLTRCVCDLGESELLWARGVVITPITHRHPLCWVGLHFPSLSGLTHGSLIRASVAFFFFLRT